MKKVKLIGLSIITTLLFFSIVNVSQAAPPSYVGVKKGDQYTWVASIDMANINTTAIALVGAGNWTLIYDMMDEMAFNETHLHLDDFLGAAVRLKISNVTDEVPLSGSIPGVGVFGQFSMKYGGIWVDMNDPADPIDIICDPSYINSTNFMYYLGEGGPPLLLPKGFPYATVTPWMNAFFATFDPIYNNITFSGITNGFNATILSEFFEWGFTQSGIPGETPTFSNVNLKATWNKNGVLDLVALSYGDLTIATLKLTSEEEEIPGFVITVFLGVGAATILGIIFVIQRKKHII